MISPDHRDDQCHNCSGFGFGILMINATTVVVLILECFILRY